MQVRVARIFNMYGSHMLDNGRVVLCPTSWRSR